MKLFKYRLAAVPRMLLLVLVMGLLTCHSALAADTLALQKVTDNVYAIIGELGNRNTGNLGNNATFGFIVTQDGVVLIDAGATYKGAQRLHAIIKRVTDKPIVLVINTGGQDHRWLGNGYFKAQGAKIIANARAVEDQKARSQDQFFVLGNLVGDKGLAGTDAVYADTTFDQNKQIEIGGTRIEIYHVGGAHTPGDSFVWLPKQKVMFTGDIVYTERMLGVINVSSSKSWLAVYEAMADYKPDIVVPGHGHPTTLQKADADTYAYLKFLRESVAAFMQAGGDISEISKIDQSQYQYLKNYDILAGRNAQRVYAELEFE
jgi:glyoxylase-like metal-dependent hydrolase (beta-lactamase superfamily II)